MDTIYALATAQGKAGVAIVRISGPLAKTGLLPFVGSFGPEKRATLRGMRDGVELLDQALVIWFEKDRSFTGEEVVELHLHGSPAIVSAVLRLLGGIPGFRLAEAGEFTRRALENGRMDLSQVEGLSDLIVAETEAQRRQAMKVFSGVLGQRTESWRSRMIRAAALLEAVLDFADEDVPVDVYPEVHALVSEVLRELRAERAGYAVAERIRDGFEVAIIGAPNVGKSTLLNRLAGREAALTSEFAGTTRDVIEVRMDLLGLPVTVLDTAGLRATIDPVEAMGIDRAVTRAQRADLRVFLLGGDDDLPVLPPEPGDLVVRGKADLGSSDGKAVSGLTGEGVEALVAEIGRALADRASSPATITRARHRDAVDGSIGALEMALTLLNEGAVSEEIVAEVLRQAVISMDSLIGKVGVEDLLGDIFASFCIGK
jgi:tRNA modification GTPase